MCECINIYLTYELEIWNCGCYNALDVLRNCLYCYCSVVSLYIINNTFNHHFIHNPLAISLTNRLAFIIFKYLLVTDDSESLFVSNLPNIKQYLIILLYISVYSRIHGWLTIL